MLQIKRPDEILGFLTDFSQALVSPETILTHTVVVSSGITKVSDARVGNVVTANLSAGTDGYQYRATFSITTSANHTYSRELLILVTTKGPSDEDIQTLRDMAGDTTLLSFSLNDLRDLLFSYAINDIVGETPWSRLSNAIGGSIVNPDWIATFDFNAAAAKLWSLKANSVIDKYDFQADGGNYSRSQVYENFMKMSRHFSSRRAIRMIRVQPTNAHVKIGDIDDQVGNA